MYLKLLCHSRCVNCSINMEELGRLISKGELRLLKHLIYQSCVISLQALKKKSEK